MNLPEEVVARLFIKRIVEKEDDDDLTPEANALRRLQATAEIELELARDEIVASGASVSSSTFAKMDSRGPAEMLRQSLTSDKQAIVERVLETRSIPKHSAYVDFHQFRSQFAAGKMNEFKRCKVQELKTLAHIERVVVDAYVSARAGEDVAAKLLNLLDIVQLSKRLRVYSVLSKVDKEDDIYG